MSVNPYAVDAAKQPRDVSDGKTWASLTRRVVFYSIYWSFFVGFAGWVTYLQTRGRIDEIFAAGIFAAILVCGIVVLQSRQLQSETWNKVCATWFSDAAALHAQAGYYFRHHDLNLASEVNRKAIAMDSNFPAARLLRAQLLSYEQGQAGAPDQTDPTTESIIQQDCDWLLEHEQSTALAMAIRGGWAYRQGRYNQSVVDCTSGIDLGANSIEAHWHRAYSLAMLNRPRESLLDTEHIRRAGWNDNNLNQLHASNLLAAEDYERAIDLASDQLAVRPEDAHWHYMHAYASLSLRWLAEAKESFEATLTYAEDSGPDRLLHLGDGDPVDQLKASAHLGLVQVHCSLGNMERAKAELLLTRQHSTEETWLLYAEALIEHQLGKFESARDLCSQLLEQLAEQAPTSETELTSETSPASERSSRTQESPAETTWPSIALVNRGYAHHALDDYEAALEDFEAAIQLKETRGFPRKYAAWLLATCPDPAYRDGNKALVYIDHDLKTPHANSVTWGVKAAALAESGRFAEAIQTQQEYLRRHQEEQWQGRVSRLDLKIPTSALQTYHNNRALHCRLLPPDAPLLTDSPPRPSSSNKSARPLDSEIS